MLHLLENEEKSNYCSSCLNVKQSSYFFQLHSRLMHLSCMSTIELGRGLGCPISKSNVAG